MKAKFSSLKAGILRSLFKIARLPLAAPLVSFFFKHMGNILPVDRLYETEHWVAFHHPQPEYPLHILIMPKLFIPSLVDAPENISVLYSELFQTVKFLIKAYQLEERAYRLLTNGGPHQSIPQWHWHLISSIPSTHLDKWCSVRKTTDDL